MFFILLVREALVWPEAKLQLHPKIFQDISRIRLLQDSVVASLSRAQSHSHGDTQRPSAVHASPSSKAVSLQLRFIKAARSTCFEEQLNADQPEQSLLEHLGKIQGLRPFNS